MATWVWIVIVVAVLVIAGLVAMMERRRRSAVLRDRFGAEYDRTVESHDDQRAAEAELRGRQKQRAKLDIKPLSEAARARYAEEWRGVQERFVDQPAEAVGSADGLVYRVMGERGYPMGDFAAQSDLVSVDHPGVVENYRVAHAIHERADSGQASTEDLREALLRYRSLFDELLRAGTEAEPTDSTKAEPTDSTPDASRNTGTLDTGTLDTGTLDTGTLDTGTLENEAPDARIPDTGTLDDDVLEGDVVPAQRATEQDPIASEASHDAR
jgi:hypothetical protein